MKVVVSDTSCISNLLVVGHIHLLQQTYHQVIIPPAVFFELRALEKFDIDLNPLLDAEWMEVRAADEKMIRAIESFNLDEGETEAIALAREIKADVLIIDEAKGREVARKFGLQTTGLLGILIKAKKDGIIFSVKPILDNLIAEANFRISKELYEQILNMINE